MNAKLFGFFAAIFMFVATLPSPAFSTDEKPADIELQKWTTYYYLEPKPELTVEMVRRMAKAGYLEDDSDASTPATFFLGQVFAQNPKKISEWMPQLKDLTEGQEDTLMLALYASNTKEARDFLLFESKNYPPALHERMVELAGQKPYNLLAQDVVNPEILDAFWGAFFATGDERYVLKVISALGEKKGEMGLVAGAAKWSLKSNAAQHKKVLQICLDQLDKQPEGVKPVLKQVIDDAFMETYSRKK
jgi:hypothetical protein